MMTLKRSGGATTDGFGWGDGRVYSLRDKAEPLFEAIAGVGGYCETEQVNILDKIVREALGSDLLCDGFLEVLIGCGVMSPFAAAVAGTYDEVLREGCCRGCWRRLFARVEGWEGLCRGCGDPCLEAEEAKGVRYPRCVKDWTEGVERCDDEGIRMAF